MPSGSDRQRFTLAPSKRSGVPAASTKRYQADGRLGSYIGGQMVLVMQGVGGDVGHQVSSDAN